MARRKALQGGKAWDTYMTSFMLSCVTETELRSGKGRDEKRGKGEREKGEGVEGKEKEKKL